MSVGRRVIVFDVPAPGRACSRSDQLLDDEFALRILQRPLVGRLQLRLEGLHEHGAVIAAHKEIVFAEDVAIGHPADEIDAGGAGFGGTQLAVGLPLTDRLHGVEAKLHQPFQLLPAQGIHPLGVAIDEVAR